MPEPFREISEAASMLTPEMIRRQVDAIWNAKLEPCRHAVHPRARGWTICANCFGAVYVEAPTEET